MSTSKTIKKIEAYLKENEINYDFIKDEELHEFTIGTYSATWYASSDTGYKELMKRLKFEAVKTVALKKIISRINLSPLQESVIKDCIGEMKGDLSSIE